MVNASLNWASIVGIALAVGGAGLYFMRSFKPALARDYDVFFAAVGLLCGGILFFQGWRLDPILQFGQFLLAATTIFFAYESVRLRGVTTEQARRSSFFDDEEPPGFRPRGGLGGRPDWDADAERFEPSEPVRRRIRSRDEEDYEDFYRPRRTSRAAIPERAVSRSRPADDWPQPRDADRPPLRGGPEPDSSPEPGRPYRADRPAEPTRYRAGGSTDRATPEFGARRRERDLGIEPRRGSRPTSRSEAMPRSSRRPAPATDTPPPGPTGVPTGTPIRGSDPRAAQGDVSDADFAPLSPRRASGSAPGGPAEPTQRPPVRDNSSRFDD